MLPDSVLVDISLDAEARPDVVAISKDMQGKHNINSMRMIEHTCVLIDSSMLVLVG